MSLKSRVMLMRTWFYLVRFVATIVQEMTLLMKLLVLDLGGLTQVSLMLGLISLGVDGGILWFRAVAFFCLLVHVLQLTIFGLVVQHLTHLYGQLVRSQSNAGLCRQRWIILCFLAMIISRSPLGLVLTRV